MREEWKFVAFSAAPVLIIDGDRGRNYPKQVDFSTAGFCVFLDAGNVTESGFEFGNVQFIDEAKDEVLRQGKLVRDDVVMTTRGTIGNVAHYSKTIPFDHMRINSGMVIFRCDQTRLLPCFLYHFFRSPYFRGQVNSLRSGVAQPQLPIRDIKRIEIAIPSLDEQSRVAAILSSYDDLIENNRRRIQLLEQAARLIYQEWFVRLRFPGHEHARVVDGVPEGWEKRTLESLADLIMGQSPESRYYNEDGVGLPFHQGVTGFGERFAIHSKFCSFEGRIAQRGDILFSVRAPVGRLNLTDDKIVIGRGLASVRSKKGHQSFLYYQLKNYFFKEDMIGEGAIFASVTRKQLATQLLLTPPNALIEQYESHSKPIDDQIRNLTQQNTGLHQARDLLLPKLMSGDRSMSGLVTIPSVRIW
jgi:type I restriction enzyme, S subunit